MSPLTHQNELIKYIAHPLQRKGPKNDTKLWPNHPSLPFDNLTNSFVHLPLNRCLLESTLSRKYASHCLLWNAFKSFDFLSAEQNWRMKRFSGAMIEKMCAKPHFPGREDHWILFDESYQRTSPFAQVLFAQLRSQTTAGLKRFNCVLELTFERDLCRYCLLVLR